MKKQLISDNLSRALSQLNLTEKEIAAYLILLKEGKSTIQEISRKTGINRVSIYAGIDELKGKGLISESKIGRRRLYVAENPESLENIVRDESEQLAKKEKQLANIIPILKAIDINQESKPVIKFFEGLAGIYKVYDEYILKSREVIGCGSYDSVMKVSSWEVEKKYIKALEKNKVFFRGILEDTETNHKFDEISKGIMHNKFLPEGTKVTADVLVFGPYVTLISYEKKSATLIEDESVAQSIKLYLEFMWERL